MIGRKGKMSKRSHSDCTYYPVLTAWLLLDGASGGVEQKIQMLVEIVDNFITNLINIQKWKNKKECHCLGICFPK